MRSEGAQMNNVAVLGFLPNLSAVQNDCTDCHRKIFSMIAAVHEGCAYLDLIWDVAATAGSMNHIMAVGWGCSDVDPLSCTSRGRDGQSTPSCRLSSSCPPGHGALAFCANRGTLHRAHNLHSQTSLHQQNSCHDSSQNRLLLVENESRG